MARTKLTVRWCLDLAHNRPKVKRPFKIKMILPEQETVQIKKMAMSLKLSMFVSKLSILTTDGLKYFEKD